MNAKSERKATYSVVVENPNSWTQCDDGSRRYEITAHCGHNHKTEEAAQRCLDKLTRWYCLCGSTYKGYCRHCHTPHNSTSARWYNASVRENEVSA